MGLAAVNGTELYFREWGGGPSLLLVHGTQPDADAWGPVPELLAARHRVIAYDRRGFSRSRRAPDTDYRVHAGDAAALLEYLRASPAAVLGWSWGALVALELAREHPEVVRSLILVEPAVHLKKHLTLALMRTALGMQVLRRLRGDAPAAECFLRWALGYRGGGSALERFPEPVRQSIRDNGDAIVAEFDAGTGEALRNEHIADIRCPVTLVLGELSQPEFHASVVRLRRLLPQAPVELITGASHAVHFDQPDELVRVVEAVTNAGKGACRTDDLMGSSPAS